MRSLLTVIARATVSFAAGSWIATQTDRLNPTVAVLLVMVVLSETRAHREAAA